MVDNDVRPSTESTASIEAISERTDEHVYLRSLKIKT